MDFDLNDFSGEIGSEDSRGHSIQLTKEVNDLEKKKEIIPSRTILFWLLSVQKNYIHYYFFLIISILINNLGLLAIPKCVGLFVDTLNSSKVQNNITLFGKFPVQEGTAYIIFLSVASIVVAIGIGFRIMAEVITGLNHFPKLSLLMMNPVKNYSPSPHLSLSLSLSFSPPRPSLFLLSLLFSLSSLLSVL
jgi:hypothetical protein